MMTSSTTEAEAEPTGRPDPGQVLTWRLQTVLQAIRNFGQRHGYASTLREIGKAAGIASPSSVSCRPAALQHTGYLLRDAKRPRTVEVRLPGQRTVRLVVRDVADALDIPSQDTAYVPVPLLGQIAAGERNLARRLVGDGTLFLLRVHGTPWSTQRSPTATWWWHARPQPEAEDGDIVVAIIDREVTVETLRRSPDQTWLMPHISAYTPNPANDATVPGKGSRSATTHLTHEQGPAGMPRHPYWSGWPQIEGRPL